MGFDQMHIRHCILYEFKKDSKASQAARNNQSVYRNEAPSILFEPSLTSSRLRVSELVNDGSNNLNEETLLSKTPFDQEDQVLSLLRFKRLWLKKIPNKMPGNWLSCSVLVSKESFETFPSLFSCIMIVL